MEGFEPSQAEPESDVLPLHHKAMFDVNLSGSLAVFVITGAKVKTFFELQKFFEDFFVRIVKKYGLEVALSDFFIILRRN